MASCSNKIHYLLMLFSFLQVLATTTQAQYAYNPNYLSYHCNKNNASRAFQLKLRTLFSSLSSNSLSNTNGFYNTTVPADNPSDAVFGFFMCRGDISPQLCQPCVQTAIQRLSTKCILSTHAVIWYDVCTVRYSNYSFFSTMDRFPMIFMARFISDQMESFMSVLSLTTNKTAEQASIRGKKFATREANVSGSLTIYSLAQCTPDLSPLDCRICLSSVFRQLPDSSRKLKQLKGFNCLTPSCNIRYELYPFYLSDVPSNRSTTQAYVPVSSFSKEDSSLSEDPTYLNHRCSTDENADSSYKMNLKTLLSYMSSNATNGMRAYKGDVDKTVYGLFMCRGDLPSRLCQQCVLNATQKISTDCSSSQEAIIWYSHCMLRYSDGYFFNILEESSTFQILNVTTSPIPEQEFFTFTLSNTLANLAPLAASDSNERYATKSLKLNDLQTLYTLAQCTQDLSNGDCNICLEDIIRNISFSHLGSLGGRVMHPSCNLRFESFQFYRSGNETQQLRNAKDSGKRKGHLRIMISVIVPTIVSVILLFLGYYLVKRKLRKSVKNILKENFGHESVTLEPLQFNLAVIQAATNNFSNENRIGKGGFGEVYKGVLLDGQQIAAKRLSKSSKQGANEFKNEVLLIAKLQHRNLVAFIGFCLEDQEKILIYEYVPNKSLDYFLFDSQRAKLLSWFERYNIIRGIARGIHYLHELSRLKVIHRDLKPSNVLLDENMFPKISDFGLARIVEINQDQGSTNRIVGTYGYMPPEYAMFGRFSEKSDVFSFGVMVLEIIIGKKNSNSYDSHSVADGLLNNVWRQWRDQTLLSILDPSIKENFSENEVIKCLQIGLLCVQLNPDARPTMAEVLSYFSSCSIEIPSPQEPAFYSHDRMDSNVIAQESSSSQSINGSTPCSVNEMSISQFLPR